MEKKQSYLTSPQGCGKRLQLSLVSGRNGGAVAFSSCKSNIVAKVSLMKEQS
jgi:hypothetical protein